MANEYYNHGTAPITTSDGSSAIIRAELLSVEAGFNKLPSFTGNANKPVMVNPAGTAMTVKTFTVSLTANLTTSGAFTTEFVNSHSSAVYLPQGNGTLVIGTTFPGFLSGCEMSNAADTVNDITIAPGICASNNAGVAVAAMTLTSAMTKQLDVPWFPGTNQGGRCSAAALANGTWHVFVIDVGGVVDVCFDNNPTGTNVASSTGATRWRRIGSFVRASGSNRQFDQFNNRFLLDAATTDVSTNNPGTSAVTAVLASIPSGIELEAKVVAKIFNTSALAAVGMLLTPLIVTDTVPTTSNAQLICDQPGFAFNASIMLDVYTDTAQSIRYRLSSSSANITAEIVSVGWTDYRGQYGGL